MKQKYHTFAYFLLALSLSFFGQLSLHAQLANVDASWGQGGVRTVDFANTFETYTTALRQADGKFLLMGTVGPGAEAQISLARVLANGQMDNSFGQNGKRILGYSPTNSHVPNQLFVHTDGKIYISFLLNENNELRRMLVRLLPNGTVDNSFGTQGYYRSPFLIQESWGAFRVMPDGKIQCYGTNREVFDGAYYARIVSFRLFSDGKPDTTYSGNTYRRHMLGPDGWFRDGVFRMATTAQGSDVLYCTRQNAVNSSVTAFLMKITSAGRLDSTFGTNGRFSYAFAGTQTTTTSIAIHPGNGRILMSGIYRLNNSEQQNPAIYAFRPNGGIDSSYGVNGIARLPMNPNNGFGNYLATDLTFDAQGRSYIAFAGRFTGITSVTFSAARFSANGQVDATFGTNGSIVSNVQGTPNKIFLDQDLLPIIAGRTNLGSIANGDDMVLVKLKPNQTTAIQTVEQQTDVYPTVVQAGSLVHLPVSLQSGAFVVSLQGKKWEVQPRQLEDSESTFFQWPAAAPGLYFLQHPSLKKPIRIVAR